MKTVHYVVIEPESGLLTHGSAKNILETLQIT